MQSHNDQRLADPATVFRLKVGQYRRLGYEVVEVNEHARRAKVCVPINRNSSGRTMPTAAHRQQAIYRLIEVDATGRVRDQRVYD
jgi:hypothetical protein